MFRILDPTFASIVDGGLSLSSRTNRKAYERGIKNRSAESAPIRDLSRRRPPPPASSRILMRSDGRNVEIRNEYNVMQS